MRIRRVALPEWVTEGPTHLIPDPDWDSVGEQIEWGLAIPWAFRALAAPDADNVMLEPPRPGDEIHTATAYWCPLVHLLVYSLGWRRPDLGAALVVRGRATGR